MKPASKWRDEFCNKVIIPTRESIVLGFVRDVQHDAVREYSQSLTWLLRNVMDEVPTEKRTPEMQDSIDKALNVITGEKVV